MGEKLREEPAFPIFQYATEDIPVFRDVSPAGFSKLDQLICTHWDAAMTRGTIFRYDLAGVSTRRLSGRFGFIVQRNPKRFSYRRTPHEMSCLTQPFNSQLFNFNRIKREEILFEVRRKSNDDGGTQEGPNIVVVNVSPIDYGHILLVPQPQSCLPQVLTEDTLRMCLEIVGLSGHSGFYMVANSLMANASVNHLHYHFLYLDHTMMADRTGGRPVTEGCYELTDHCSRGFGFQMDTTPKECARKIYGVVSLLLELGLPHNLAMHRGQPFDQQQGAGRRGGGEGSSEEKMVVRTLLIPRKPSFGLKTMFDEGNMPPFFPAACEMVLGFLPVVDQFKYDSLTEEEILQLLDEKTLSQEDIDSLKERIKTAIPGS